VEATARQPLGIERTDFISVPTRDMERAKRFYGETLGLPPARGNEKFPQFETGNVTILLLDPDSIGTTFAPNRSGFALRVPDVAAARERLEGEGVEFFGEVVDTGVCHMAFFADPDGNGIVLHNRYAPLS
jgi:catechol 2,3-dioxygenase-like lactoylglutathione lyase family enzyme